METAKVDIRRLQVLNDCINRTIEALNQVRLSVHAGGLQHAAALGGVGGYVQSPYLASPLATMGFPSAYSAYGVPGIGHSAAAAYYPQFAAAQSAWASQSPWAASQGIGGLGHSAWGNDLDPYAQTRISQTFPFVHWGYSPYGWPSV